MSCNFNLKACSNCPKYNGCLLQLTYANTLGLANLHESLLSSVQQIVDKTNVQQNSYADDSVELMSDIEVLKKTSDNLLKSHQSLDETLNELISDISEIKSSLSVINLKVDDLTSDDMN